MHGMTQLLQNFLDRPIRLQAVNAARNIARRYAINTHRDLFGAITVEYGWGRIGTRGQGRVASFARDEEAERFVCQLLRRRAGARRRLGVAYREVR